MWAIAGAGGWSWVLGVWAAFTAKRLQEGNHCGKITTALHIRVQGSHSDNQNRLRPNSGWQRRQHTFTGRRLARAPGRRTPGSSTLRAVPSLHAASHTSFWIRWQSAPFRHHTSAPFRHHTLRFATIKMGSIPLIHLRTFSGYEPVWIVPILLFLLELEQVFCLAGLIYEGSNTFARLKVGSVY